MTARRIGFHAVWTDVPEHEDMEPVPDQGSVRGPDCAPLIEASVGYQTQFDAPSTFTPWTNGKWGSDADYVPSPPSEPTWIDRAWEKITGTPSPIAPTGNIPPSSPPPPSQPHVTVIITPSK